MSKQRSFEFAMTPMPTSPAQMAAPGGYRGLYGFHKYWGKKPHEPLAYAIDRLTQPGEIVLDPFVGSGTAAREAIISRRRFIGFDINPVACELTKLILSPPDGHSLAGAVRKIESECKAQIEKSYSLTDLTMPATHYLWEAGQLRQVWISGRGSTSRRLELAPTIHDVQLASSFAAYTSRYIRQPRFFSNARINAAPAMRLADIFTGRAQRNLDILLEAIHSASGLLVPALKLCLTAASGQMSKMVFAVTGRGKTSGQVSQRTEVGSWVIGYWRPRTHFEVNVWNCFQHRTSKLINALGDAMPTQLGAISNRPLDVVDHAFNASVTRGDCRNLLDEIPNSSVKLVITDPPHSDRMPYLELSELWNSILGEEADFENEIVISNAKERDKKAAAYSSDIVELFNKLARVLTSDGHLIMMFNARTRLGWDAFSTLCRADGKSARSGLRYVGRFPCTYSAGSVVQDNRKGSLKGDLALVFSKADASAQRFDRALSGIPNWSTERPERLLDA